ncbi:sterol desaturase family protein [Hymenobacter sp. 15J16-1T3B]|uniref:sterol desaturase family protein n=1 Tax=Hymenobacter sp. 15J16-1T3B TaxID=2886941 RepID=UPI001D11E6BB|nr:sterol desaturase family protein [Hymenobacter sp. 15J16-1T3B]MCC3158196.1 sterol desaturase family protein [Hymenobacter sp. 15J16-1T3B]
MNLPAGLALSGLTFLGMEFVAWFMHRFVLHGPLWFVHRSHHVRHPHRFERNDFSFVFYGALSVLLMVYGGPAKDWRYWVGGGIAAYGTLYFFVHDVLIHRRLPFWKRTHNTYLRALNMAHKMHHKTTGRDGSEEFGLLWVSPKYFALARRKPGAGARPERPAAAQ